MSNTVFVVKNQQDLYLSKQQEWVDGADNQSLYRTRHRDEAINTVFEVSSRDIYLRAEAVACELDGKGNPALATVQVLSAAKISAADDLDIDEEPVAEPEQANADAADTEPADAEASHSETAVEQQTDAEMTTPENIET